MTVPTLKPIAPKPVQQHQQQQPQLQLQPRLQQQQQQPAAMLNGPLTAPILPQVPRHAFTVTAATSSTAATAPGGSGGCASSNSLSLQQRRATYPVPPATVSSSVAQHSQSGSVAAAVAVAVSAAGAGAALPNGMAAHTKNTNLSHKQLQQSTHVSTAGQPPSTSNNTAPTRQMHHHQQHHQQQQQQQQQQRIPVQAFQPLSMLTPMSNASSALPSVFRSPVSFAPASAGRSRSSGRHGGQQTTTRARRNIPELTKARLKEYYSTNTKPTMAEREQIAHELGMNQRSVTIWFQNQRATAKKNQLAMEKGALEAMAAVAAAVSKEKDLVESPELVSPTEAAKGSASADDVLIESTAASSIPSLQSLDSDEHESVGERCAVDEPVVTSKRGSISMDGPDCLVEGGACGGAAVKMRKSSVTLNGMTLASPKQAVLSPPVMLKRPITASFSGTSSSTLQSPSTESAAGHKQPSQQQMLLPSMTPRPPSLLMSMYGAMPRPIGPEAFAQLLSSPLSPNPAPLATIPDEVPASGMSQGPRLCLESSYERLLQDNVTSAHPPQSAISAEPHLDIGGDLVHISAPNAKNPLLTHVPFSSGGSTNVLELQRSLLQLQQQRQQQQLRVITNTVPSGSSSSTEASTQSSPLSADSLPTSASTAGALINSHPSLLYNIASLSTSVPPSGLSISSLASAAASQPMAINLSAFASAAAATAAAAAAGTQVPSVMSLSMPLGTATESVDSSIIRSLYLTSNIPGMMPIAAPLTPNTTTMPRQPPLQSPLHPQFNISHQLPHPQTSFQSTNPMHTQSEFTSLLSASSSNDTQLEILRLLQQQQQQQQQQQPRQSIALPQTTQLLSPITPNVPSHPSISSNTSSADLLANGLFPNGPLTPANLSKMPTLDAGSLDAITALVNGTLGTSTNNSKSLSIQQSASHEIEAGNVRQVSNLQDWIMSSSSSSKV